MKIILILSISLMLINLGCMSTNQLVAEQTYYRMQADIKRYELEQERLKWEAQQNFQQTIQSQKVLEIIAGDSSKPMVFENVSAINAYAMPQIPQQPVIINSNQEKSIPQYVQRDYAAPWVGLLSKTIGWVVPAFAAYKIFDSAMSNSGTHMTNYGANSEMILSGDRNISGTTVGNGQFNLESELDYTHNPTVIRAPDPLIVNPVVVDPVIVDPVVVP